MAHARVATTGAISTRTNEDLYENGKENCYMVRQHIYDTLLSVEWQSTDVPGHYGGHPRPQVADRGTPSSMDNRVAPDKVGAVDK